MVDRRDRAFETPSNKLQICLAHYGLKVWAQARPKENSAVAVPSFVLNSSKESYSGSDREKLHVLTLGSLLVEP